MTSTRNDRKSGIALVCRPCLRRWGALSTMLTLAVSNTLTLVPSLAVTVLRRNCSNAGADRRRELSTRIKPGELDIWSLMLPSVSNSPSGRASRLPGRQIQATKTDTGFVLGGYNTLREHPRGEDVLLKKLALLRLVDEDATQLDIL
jgi:hypothetical protein